MQDWELFIFAAHTQQSTIGPSDWNGTMTYANTAILRMLWLALFKLKLEPPFQVAYDKNVVWFILHIRMSCCFYLEFIWMKNQICGVSHDSETLQDPASLFAIFLVEKMVNNLLEQSALDSETRDKLGKLLANAKEFLSSSQLRHI